MIFVALVDGCSLRKAVTNIPFVSSLSNYYQSMTFDLEVAASSIPSALLSNLRLSQPEDSVKLGIPALSVVEL